MDSIKLPISLGLIVWDELEKKGIKRRDDPRTGLLSLEFSQEELNSIEKLHLTDLTAGSLRGLSNLKGLKSLCIDRRYIRIKGHTPRSGIYIPQDHYTLQRNVPSISDKDILEIEKLESLESLSIVGQSKVTDLDVSRLTNLKDLNVSGNMRLESIDGIDRLQQLEGLTLIGNHELTEINGFNQCMNNGKVETASLDPQLFPKAINYDHRTGIEDTQLIEKIKNGDIDIQFYETMTSRDGIKMNISQMLMIHEKAKKIVNFINGMHLNIRERIMLTQAYLGDMVRYDTESLKNNHTHSENGIVQGPLHGANGLFNCLYYNTCVCEGYTRGAKYLLSLQGIKSREVSCISGKDSGNFAKEENNQYSQGLKLPDDGYHSILLVQDTASGEWGYCDPCWNAAYYQKRGTMPFMLMGNEEIKKTHTLSLEEQNISIASDLYHREVITKETGCVIQKYQQRKKEIMKNRYHDTKQHEEPER